MNDNQINAAIAQACGWTDIEECTCGFKTRGNPPEGSAHKKHIPNYCTDLNAIHEAEKTIASTFGKYYVTQLARVTGAEYPDDLIFFFATARQRAEAFLRALGKWDEPVKECFTTEADHLGDAAKKVGEVQP